MEGGPGFVRALMVSGFIASACLAVLSLLGWRRTLKRVAVVLLLVSALVAACIWVQGLPLDGTLLGQGLRPLLFPAWPSLLRWQFPTLLVVLGVVPALWLSQLRLRRLSGSKQMQANVAGMALGLAAMVLTGWFAFGP